MSFGSTQFFGSSMRREGELTLRESARTWASFRIPGTLAKQKKNETEVPPPVGMPIQDDSSTFIELGAVFEGTLKLTGDFRIDNEFKGELTTDGTVIVGPDGSIEGDIIARQVEVEGAVMGNVTARRMCILRSTARFHGNIETACIQIEPHAYFRGGTRMLHPIAKPSSSIVSQPTVQD